MIYNFNIILMFRLLIILLLINLYSCDTQSNRIKPIDDIELMKSNFKDVYLKEQSDKGVNLKIKDIQIIKIDTLNRIEAYSNILYSVNRDFNDRFENYIKNNNGEKYLDSIFYFNQFIKNNIDSFGKFSIEKKAYNIKIILTAYQFEGADSLENQINFNLFYESNLNLINPKLYRWNFKLK